MNQRGALKAEDTSARELQEILAYVEELRGTNNRLRDRITELESSIVRTRDTIIQDPSVGEKETNY